MRLGEWLESNHQRSGSRVIFAPDLVGPYSTRVERAAELVSRLGRDLVGVKVNWHLLLTSGVVGLRPLADACARAGLPLIADMKLNDIASTNLEAARILFSNGFEALIANPFVGREEALGDLIDEAHRAGKGVVLLVYMSHAGAKEGYGLRVGGRPLYLRFASDAAKWEADAVVVSAKSPAIIRSVRRTVGREMPIMSPGVGAQGGDAARAVSAGADYIIVGRTIFEASDPAMEVRALNAAPGRPRSL